MDLKFSINSILNIRGRTYRIVGVVSYRNNGDGSYWDEYRLIEEGTHQEMWLSIDNVYDEYAMYHMTGFNALFTEQGIRDAGYHEADSGVQTVVRNQGRYLDVDTGETARYWEYEDVSEENIIAIEEWSDGKEYSTGFYVEKNEILVVSDGNIEENQQGFIYNSSSNVGEDIKEKIEKRLFTYSMLVMIITVGIVIFFRTFSSFNRNTIAKFLTDNIYYTYRTSITSDTNTKQKADVYVSSFDVEAAAKNIIDGMEGDVEDVQRNTEDEDDSIAILTEDEYCFIYTSSDNETLVQVSKREYAYSNDDDLYRSRTGSRRYYRRYYYSRGYSSDKSRYSQSTDSYRGYSDFAIGGSTDTLNSYASSVRQSSIARRRSSGGGTSHGK